MNQPIVPTPKCYTWHQFTAPGEWTDETWHFRRGAWNLRTDIHAWLADNIKGQWSVIEGERCPLFIEDGRDAMMFKLVWSDEL